VGFNFFGGKMCCLITALVFLGPRLTIIGWYLLDTTRWQEVYNTFLVPCVGFFLLPWTTLMYVFVSPNGGINGFDWVLMLIALLADLSSYGGGGYGNRKHIRRYRTRD
jgi:hypothetical protein